MSLFLQDPTSLTAIRLLDILKEHFKEADEIYCAFAFVTAKGASMLFEQEEDVNKSLKKAKVHLLVGMDAITDTKAIKKLSELCFEFKNFKVDVFLPRAGGIFHPKFSWVKKGKTGIVIAGSGNLTTGGLQNNYEAFTVSEAAQGEISILKKSWKKFLTHNKDSLFSLDAEEVLEAAKQNAKLKKVAKATRKSVGKKEHIVVLPKRDSAVFIEELTKGRGNKQRDVGTWAADNYFEETPPLFLTHVDDIGVCGSTEMRKIIPKGSSNFAIDLNASQGIESEEGKMPIVIFIRTQPRTYLYHIIQHGSAHYKTIHTYLENNGIKKAKAWRLEKALSAKELKAIWPQAPFWSLEEE